MVMAELETLQTVLTLVSSAVAAMGGVVAFLWRQISANNQKTESKLEKCEQSHQATHDMILGLTRKVGELEGRQQGISELADQVLAVVAKQKDDS